MATIDWPTSLPQQLRVQGFGQTPLSGTIRTETAIGPAKLRQRYSAVPEDVRGTLLITKTQVTTLRTFYKDTLLSGSQPFNWVDPIDGSTVEMRFKEAITYESVGNDLYIARLTLEITP